MSLPALITDTPEHFRRLNALTELVAIQRATEEQQAVADYADEAAEAILRTDVELPEDAADVQQLFLQLCIGDQGTPDFSKAKLRQDLIDDNSTTVAQQEGVTSKDIRRVMAQLHPDQVVKDDEIASTDGHEEAFKRLSRAKKDGDTKAAQRGYALATALIASGSEADTEALETARYKAYVALQAGATRFTTRAEVDEWKEQQLRELPIRQRGVMLAQTMGLFAYTLNADKSGMIRLDPVYGEQIAASIEAVQARIKQLLEVDLSDTVANSFDRVDFDEQYEEAVKLLTELLHTHKTLGSIAGYQAVAFGRKLERICRGRPQDIDIGRFALSSLGLTRSLTSFEEDPYGYGSDKTIIKSSFGTEKYSNPRKDY